MRILRRELGMPLEWIRVTMILDFFKPPALVDWLIRVGKREARRTSTIATKQGTRVHELIEKDCKGQEVKFLKKDVIEIRNCFEAWQRFKKEHDVEIFQMEQEVKDDELRVVGHYDALCRIDGVTTLLDFKTSKRISDNYWLQLAKYWDMCPNRPVQVAVLRLDKNLGEYEFKTNEQVGFDIGEGIEIFNGLVMAYRYYNAPSGDEKEGCYGNVNAAESKVRGRQPLDLTKDPYDRTTEDW